MASTSNITLLYLIKHHSPQAFKDYRILLANTYITQLMVIITTCCMQQRFLEANNTMGLLPIGPVRYLGPSASFAFYNFYNGCQVNVLWSLMLSMHFRRSLIKMKGVTRKQLVRNLVVCYIASLNLLLSPYIPAVDFEHVTKRVIEAYPEYRLEFYGPIGGFTSTSDLIYTFNTAILLSSMVYPLLIFYWRSKILQTLDQSQSFSAKTVESTKRMIHALTFQSMLILLAYSTTSIYFITIQVTGIEGTLRMMSQITKRGFTIMEYLHLALASFPCLADPLSTIYFVAPYRLWVEKKVLRIRHAKKTTSDTNSSLHVSRISNTL
ncbi:unnamed protein product [Caenorhabditis auriculariae]|uniref:Uncharacterized protein n=1 Tax=Caenorhabditis auriculariae TaxID=2777116 RepID=A0A8S1GXI9_9PELO|nr:unnamed protein product [Caenorhabditis auriculariae]